MSIIITNDGSNISPRGEHGYVVRINDAVITTFKHTREKGLAACLRDAADAVDANDLQRHKEKVNYLQTLVDHNTRIYNGKR